VVRQGKGSAVTRGGRYRKAFIYVLKDMALETAFPFTIGEDITVVIEGDTLIIKKRQ
jgi:hypothetical protein